MDPVFDVRDKVVLVTGASKGLGRAMSKALAERGAIVIAVSRKAELLDELLVELQDWTPKCVAIAANVGRPEDLQMLAQEVEMLFGKLDVLINNAATNPAHGKIDEIPESAWDKVLQVNLTGPFLLSRALLHLMAPGSSIINVASAGAFRASPGLGAYNVSKAGLVMLSKVCAEDWAPRGIRVNAIAPGLFKTDMSRALWDDSSAMAAGSDRRLGEPEEIVGAAVFLASSASSFMSGQVMIVSPRSVN